MAGFKTENLLYGCGFVVSQDPIAKNGFVTDGLISFLHSAANTGTGYDPNSTTWANLVEDGIDADLSNFAYNSSSGWNGSNTVGDPTYLIADGIDDMVEMTGSASIINESEFTFVTIVEQAALKNLTGFTRKGVSIRQRYFNTLTAPQFTMGSNNIVADSLLATGTPVMITSVYDNGTMKQYIGDTLQADTLSSVSYSNTADDIEFFRYDGSTYTEARIYVQSIYNKALSQAEVTQNNNAGLVWRF